MPLSKRDLVAGLVVTIIWGANFSVIGLGLHSLNPFMLTLLRFTFCALPLVLFVPKPRGVSYATLAAYGVLFGAGFGVAHLLLVLWLTAECGAGGCDWVGVCGDCDFRQFGGDYGWVGAVVGMGVYPLFL